MSGPNITCPEHPQAILIEDHHAGDMICPVCGRVVGDRVVDVGSEWRTFSDSNNDPSRVGGPENPLFENDLSTRIGVSTGATEYHNRSSMSSSNRTLLAAFREISEMSERVGFPKVITEQAECYYKQVHEERKLRNRARLAVVTACIYLACRQNNASRSLKELSTISGVPSSLIAKCFKAITKVIDVETNQVESADFLSRFCSNLNLPISVQRIATHIVKAAREGSITDGRNPTSVAAASIYMATQIAGEKKGQREISEVCGCAEPTLRQSYRLMYSRATDLVPPDPEYQARISLLSPS